MDDLDLLDCLNCGGKLEGKVVSMAVYADGEDITCKECSFINHIGCDREEGAYVQSYTCKHGRADDVLCDECEEDDNA